jgi:ATPase subunit of ABC transporter with duplicated ATPase domains
VVAYAGNYSDYREQRSAAQPETKRGTEKGIKPPKTSSPVRAQRLSYKEKQELETIVGEIERTESEAAEVEALLNDPTLYADRAEQVPAIVARQGELRAQVDRLMTRWMELEAKSNPA